MPLLPTDEQEDSNALFVNILHLLHSNKACCLLLASFTTFLHRFPLSFRFLWLSTVPTGSLGQILLPSVRTRATQSFAKLNLVIPLRLRSSRSLPLQIGDTPWWFLETCSASSNLSCAFSEKVCYHCQESYSFRGIIINQVSLHHHYEVRSSVTTRNCDACVEYKCHYTTMLVALLLRTWVWNLRIRRYSQLVFLQMR